MRNMDLTKTFVKKKLKNKQANKTDKNPSLRTTSHS